MGASRILFLTRFTELSAYTRYRVCQYLPFVRGAGFDCVVDSLFPATYIQRTYGGNSRRAALVKLAPQVCAWLAKRVLFLLRARGRFDVIYLQYEAVPYLPLAAEEALLGSNARLVIDFDDAVHLNYEQHPNRIVRRLLRSKVAGLVSSSHSVITANRHLAEWAATHNPSVTTIPNAVDLLKYSGATRKRDNADRVVIGWIGTPVTAKYLRLIERPLRILSRQHDFVLKVIGAPEFRMEGVNVVARRWSEATEADELRSCDIGIMPLPDDPWARGKSALKLIQYMASGMAACASPVGANRDVLQEGRNGVFAATDEEWVRQLGVLMRDTAYRERLAAEGRRTAEERFSVRANAERFLGVLRAAAGAGGS